MPDDLSNRISNFVGTDIAELSSLWRVMHFWGCTFCPSIFTSVSSGALVTRFVDTKFQMPFLSMMTMFEVVKIFRNGPTVFDCCFSAPRCWEKWLSWAGQGIGWQIPTSLIRTLYWRELNFQSSTCSMLERYSMFSQYMSGAWRDFAKRARKISVVEVVSTYRSGFTTGNPTRQDNMGLNLVDPVK